MKLSKIENLCHWLHHFGCQKSNQAHYVLGRCNATKVPSTVGLKRRQPATRMTQSSVAMVRVILSLYLVNMSNFCS